MTKNNLLNISCIYNDNALAFLFYFLNAVLNKKNNELMHFDRGFTVQFRNNTKDWLDGLSDIEKKERLFNLKEDDLNKTIIHITIDVKEDNADIFSCRYLALIISLLRRMDHVSFHCDRYSFIEKCASYLCLQNIDVPERGIPLKNGKLLKKFSCSTEWFPSIYLSKKNSILYDILSNPIIDNADEMNKALQYHSDQGRTLDLRYIWHENSGLKEKKDQYKACLKECFVKWLNGRLSKVPLQNKLCSISGLSQLLFAIICNRFWAQTTKIISAEEAGKLLDICCDFGDCILQIAENIVSHSEGGVLSIRINDNWDNTDYSLKPKVPGSESQKEIKRNKPWYIRISLVDYSTNSILDNIKKQSGILSLTLSHIFMDQNPYVGMNPEDYQRTAAEYNKYLGRAAQIIHHYGLMVFKSIVDQYNGSFTVKSDSKHHLEDVDMYAPASVSIERVSLDRKAHIYGTEYDVMLPLEKSWLQKPETYNNPSLLLTPKYIVPSMKKMIVFEEDENKPQLFRYFNDRLQRIIQDLFKSKGNQYSYQELKEEVVNQASKELAGLLAKKPISKSVFYFYISEKTQRYFGRAEIIAKVILQTIVELKDKGKIGNRKELLMVLYGFSENKLVLFARQYALFYHRTDGNSKMENCKLFAVSDNYQAEVMFAGIKLSFISDYSRGRRLVTGSSAKISNVLSHIAGREGKIENETDENPPMVFPFELLNRMEIEQSPDKTRVILSKHNKWYHYHLNRILCNDIHKSDLGCQLKNAHIRIGRLHQHSFFEGQLLFANTYWYQVFSHYICEMVLNDNAITEGKSILLYGYETYSEQMLFSAVKKLEDNGRKAYYAVFENPKYITPSETSEQKIRYFDRFLESCTDDICIVYIFGIGTTLTTITDRMYAELQNTLKEKLKSKKKAYLLDTAYQKGIVIIQVSCQTDKSIKCDEKTHTVTTTFTNLPFSKNKESNYCHYLIEARTEWHQAEECPDCLKAANYLDELPLMQTNETSTVPMTLIKPWKSFAVSSKFVQEKTYTEDFLHNEENSKYLYYCHLDRSGNHYQFYIRTAALLNDLLLKDYANDASKNPLWDWFDEIRKKELQPIKPSGHEIRINILVSPQHFSNEALVAAINQYVFDGEAYIIHFDVKKEFRSSFVAKFQNYYSAIEMLRKEDLNQSIVLNFYFVDDMIVTGTTFNRAKSLVISMLGNFYPWIHVERKTTEPFISEDRKIHVNLFKGLIILINRNSKESLLNYINPKQLRKNADSVRLLPVYRFIELNTPAIRSYGDSCPICNKLARIKRLESESSLTNVEKHWREKELYHGLKKLSDAATDKIMKNDQTKDPFYKGRGLRRLHCSEMIWSKIDEGLITSENAQEQLEDLINTFLCQKENVKEKVEYLMSFLKIISREHIIYQEAVQPAALKILLRCFSVFIDTETVARNGLYKTIEILIEDESILNDRTKHPYLLYKLIIARLCAMGSIVFCRKEQLLKCIEIGLKLEEDAGGRQGQALDIPAEERFSCFLCIQIKKMLFVTQDYDFRVTVLQNLLSSCINERINLPDAKDDRQLHLLMSLYLEAVSDKTRNGFLQNEPAVLSDQTDKIETFKKKIATDSYDDIMEKFRNMMLAETAIMFQTKNQEDLEKKELNQYKVKEADITVLAQSKEDDNKRIGIIRSELLKFYQKEQYDANRSILMDIDNTARIVKVEANQEDHTVLSYCRTPCTIVYIRIDYIDAVDPKDPKPVFFAFLYPYKKSDCLFWLLRQMQLFLSFRHTLKLRIEKDFIGNLFGKSKAESWRTLWLSIEKAGAHTDSSGISRLIKEHQFEYPYTMKTLLQGREDSGKGSEKDRKYLMRLVYNVYIAMYYRSVISEGDQFISVDNITNDDSVGERYCKVKDLMEFSAKVSSDIEIVFGQEGGERQNAKMINDAELYGEESLPQDNAGSRTSGMTEPKKITFRQKYLQAFIADILCNIERYGEKGSKAEIFIEPSANGPAYLVFRNLVPTGTIPNGKSLQLFCIEKNYSLKQSIEYDNVKSDGAKGISLGCIAHCMRSAGTPGLIVYYSAKDNKVYFTIKLPIIQCSNQPK